MKFNKFKSGYNIWFHLIYFYLNAVNFFKDFFVVYRPNGITTSLFSVTVYPTIFSNIYKCVEIGMRRCAT
jgi:hypothetical protein